MIVVINKYLLPHPLRDPPRRTALYMERPAVFHEMVRPGSLKHQPLLDPRSRKLTGKDHRREALCSRFNRYLRKPCGFPAPVRSAHDGKLPLDEPVQPAVNGVYPAFDRNELRAVHRLDLVYPVKHAVYLPELVSAKQHRSPRHAGQHLAVLDELFHLRVRDVVRIHARVLFPKPEIFVSRDAHFRSKPPAGFLTSCAPPARGSPLASLSQMMPRQLFAIHSFTRPQTAFSPY